MRADVIFHLHEQHPSPRENGPAGTAGLNRVSFPRIFRPNFAALALASLTLVLGGCALPPSLHYEGDRVVFNASQQKKIERITAKLVALGPKWTDATALLEILAFFGIAQVLQSNSYSAFIALGKQHVFARITAFRVVVLLACLLFFTPLYGTLGAAWTYLIAALAAMPLNFFFITRFLGLRATDVLAGLWRPLLSAGVMYGIGRQWGPTLPATAVSSADALIPFIACVALGAVTYVAADLLLWFICRRPAGAETWLLHEVRSRIQAARTRFATPRSG